MTVLYKPVLIESAKQAEALPQGTVAISEEFAPEVFVKDEGSWMGTHGPGAFTNESAVGLEALVPIEAEEDRGTLDLPEMLGGGRNVPVTRLVTPWEAV